MRFSCPRSTTKKGPGERGREECVRRRGEGERERDWGGAGGRQGKEDEPRSDAAYSQGIIL